VSETSPSSELPPGLVHSAADNPYISPTARDASDVPVASEISQPFIVTEPRWGFWATIALGVAVVCVFLGLQTVVVIPFVIVKMATADGKADPTAMAASLGSDGLLLGLATLVSVPPSIGLVSLFAKLKRGATVRGHLGIHGVSPRVAGLAIGAVLVYVAAAQVLGYALGWDGSTFMVDAYTTAAFLPLLWIALVALAPLFEEIFFRGFLLEGLRTSRLGPFGAVVLTSFAWACAHIQYDAYYIGVIFGGGLLLGTVKLRTGSTLLAIAMHALWNVIAMLEVVVYLQMNGNGVG